MGTYRDLLIEAGLESPTARAAREGAPPPLYEPPQPNSEAARAYNRRRRAPAARADYAQQAPRQAYVPSGNQFAELPQMALESTGVPSLYRGYQGYTDGVSGTENDQAANEQLLWGGVGLAGTLGALPAGRGRGVRPPMREPFPDFGLPEFDVYHGTMRDVQGPLRRSGSGALGPGTYVARNPQTTEVFAGTPQGREIVFGEGANIMPLRARGRMATIDQWESAVAQQLRRLRRNRPDAEVEDAAVQDLQQRGFHGVEDPSRDFLSIFDSGEALSSRFGAPENPPPDLGTPPDAVPALRPPPRQFGANGLPIAEPQPFRNSMRGGSEDLMDAARANGPDAGRLGSENALIPAVEPMSPATEFVRVVGGMRDELNTARADIDHLLNRRAGELVRELRDNGTLDAPEAILSPPPRAEPAAASRNGVTLDGEWRDTTLPDGGSAGAGSAPSQLPPLTPANDVGALRRAFPERLPETGANYTNPDWLGAPANEMSLQGMADDLDARFGPVTQAEMDAFAAEMASRPPPRIPRRPETPRDEAIGNILERNPNATDAELARVWDDSVRAGNIDSAGALRLAQRYRQRFIQRNAGAYDLPPPSPPNGSQSRPPPFTQEPPPSGALSYRRPEE